MKNPKFVVCFFKLKIELQAIKLDLTVVSVELPNLISSKLI